MVEIGSYITHTGEIKHLEQSISLAVIVRQMSGVTVEIPSGTGTIPHTGTILHVKTTHSDNESAAQRLEQAVSFIIHRHQAISERMNEVQRLNSTAIVGDVQHTINEPKNKRQLVIAVATVLGGMLAIFIVLVASAIQKRREQKLGDDKN